MINSRVFILLFEVLVLWKYASAQGGTWIWIKGNNTFRSQTIYGTQGVPNLNNTPGALWNAAYTTDIEGNFWIFGGMYDSSGGVWKATSDLWKYDPKVNTWTWIKGPGISGMPPVYGEKGVPDFANNPGANQFGYLFWRDNQDNFWLYGGDGANSSDALWKYSIDLNQWAWMNGSADGQHYTPVYGTPGHLSYDNTPGNRFGSACWIDTNNNLWLYGGASAVSGSNLNYIYSDVWCYSTTLNQWIWISGPEGPGNKGNYGVKNIEAATNRPPPRMDCSYWSDSLGNFYIFGGLSPSGVVDSFYNDLWKYNPSTNKWTWISGDSLPNAPGTYSQQCSDRKDNKPGARCFSSSRYTGGLNNNIYVFGGATIDIPRHSYNDLWVFDIANQKWSWICGPSGLNNFGNYGTLNVPSSTNQIPARYGFCSWVDTSGALWIFGGNCVYKELNTGDSSCSYYGKNDLWKFVPDTSCVHITPCNSSSTSVDIFIPNAFTPNGDGVNDRLTIFGKNITQYEIKIFNRAGQLMYLSDDATEVNDTTRGWDGTCKGHLQETGVYVYYITGKNISGTPFDKKGSVTLIR